MPVWRSVAVGFIMAVALSGGVAQAHGPSRQKASEEATLGASVDEVWAVVGNFADMKISVVGEVARPGQYDVTRDKISIFDALAMAGDLTIYGIRTDVAVAREVDGVRTIEYLDLSEVWYERPTAKP